MRMDQFAGFTQDACKFLADNEVKPIICDHCKRPFPRKLELIVHILAKASYAPSPQACEMTKKNCDGCQRSRESNIPFRGPIPSFC